MGKIGCPVQWVDDPAVVALRPINGRFFFGEDGVVGEALLKDVNDALFGLEVDVGYEIDG